MSDAERWEAIWEGAFETVRRLLEGDSVTDDDDLAPVLELVPDDKPEDVS